MVSALLWSGILKFLVMSFMNLITGFFGVPWLFFLRNNLGYVLFLLLLSGFCFSVFLFFRFFFFSVFENMVGYLVWRG